MKIVLFILLGLIALLALAALVLQIAGSRMPRDHRAQVAVTLHTSRAVVWAAITDYAAMPPWWPAVKAIRMEKLPDGTELTWNKNEHNREVAFKTKSERTGIQLVREIVGDDSPFGGTWTYDLADDGAGGTRLTLTEDGFIKPPIFRAVATWFYGLDTTMKDFASHLESHLAGRKP